MEKTRSSKTEKIATVEVWKIGTNDVTISYDRQDGMQPENINAGCSIVPATTGGTMQPIFINVSRQATGSKSVSINGDIEVVDVAELIDAIKDTLDSIATEGSAA